VRLLAGILALLFSLSAFCLAVGEVKRAELPREALEAIALIRQGGPFPYPKDGVAFGNRERLLPSRERGWYREYTVKTPGSRDRGARRIVAGRDGTLYYTDDHYRSFRRILE
jgi:ribonuclease T1